MKSSMSSLARSRGSTARPLTASPSKRARTSSVSRLQRALFVAARAQALRHRVLQPHVLGEAGDGRQRRRRRRPRPGATLRPTGRRAWRGCARGRGGRPPPPPRRPASTVIPTTIGQAVLTGVQRGEVRAQAVRQHGEDARRRVDGGGVDAGVRVDRRAGRDGRAHVGDRHQDPRAAVRLALGDGELVEVERVVVVDGAPEQAAEVVGARAVRREVRQRAGLGERPRRELGLQAVLDHRVARDARQQVAVLV